MRQIEEAYAGTGKVRYVFNNYAFLRPESTAAAEAVLCANDQGMFWPYHDMLFENAGPHSNGTLERFAETLSLDTDQFDACLNDGVHSQDVENKLVEGDSKGVGSTPTMLINGTPIVGAQSFDYYQEVIEAALAQAGE